MEVVAVVVVVVVAVVVVVVVVVVVGCNSSLARFPHPNLIATLGFINPTFAKSVVWEGGQQIDAPPSESVAACFLLACPKLGVSQRPPGLMPDQ